MVFGTTILGSNPSAPAKYRMLFISNIRKILFPFYKEKNVKEILKILNKEKINNAMLVGGCVRNFLNKQTIGDIDIATVFSPGEVIKKFSNSNFRIIKTGISHGTITLFKGGKNFEITTLRRDISTDGRHAKVLFTKDWKEDSERRDFTFNAIYLDQNGKLFDPQNGVKDLKEKKIRFIGDPQQRIQEDYLRILRFLRFSIEYQDFVIEDDVLKVIKKNLNGIANLSRERVYSELNKIINLDNLRDIFQSKDLYEILQIVFPEFRYLDRLQGINHEIFNKYLKSDPHLILSLILIDDKDNHLYFCHKYKVSNYLKDNLNFIQNFFYIAKKNKNFFKKDLKKNIFYHGKRRILSLSKFYFIFHHKKNYKNLQSVLDEINSFDIPVFPITGKHLLERGMKSGRKIGEVLKKIEKDWIDNDFSLDDDKLQNLISKNI